MIPHELIRCNLLFSGEIEELGGVKMHEHAAEQGYFVIEEKKLRCIGKEKTKVEAGTAIYILPPGVPHSFRAIGKDELRLIMIYSPPDKDKR